MEGTDGLARGTIGWPSYPARTPSTLDFTTKRQPDFWFQPRWKEVWFPDAFVGTMAQLLRAIENNSEPEISGRDNLGTIARSGTAAFLEEMSSEAKDLSLIGQFGVGFYAAFMVAERVEVLSRKAGESEGWRWESAGKGEFSVGPAEVAARGTTIILHLRKGEEEYLEADRLRRIVTTHSDHVGLPTAQVLNEILLLRSLQGDPSPRKT